MFNEIKKIAEDLLKNNSFVYLNIYSINNFKLFNKR